MARHPAIKALDTLTHASHRWRTPWDNTRNDSRSESWSVECVRCNHAALIYFEHPHDEPEIDPELIKPCVPFSIEDGELMAMASEIDSLCRKYGTAKVKEYLLDGEA